MPYRTPPDRSRYLWRVGPRPRISPLFQYLRGCWMYRNIARTALREASQFFSLPIRSPGAAILDRGRSSRAARLLLGRGIAIAASLCSAISFASPSPPSLTHHRPLPRHQAVTHHEAAARAPLPRARTSTPPRMTGSEKGSPRTSPPGIQRRDESCVPPVKPAPATHTG